MNKGLIFTFSFAIGAVAGSVATWKLLQAKYEQLAKDEINEVREYYASLMGKNEGSTEKNDDVSSDEPSGEKLSGLVTEINNEERIEYSKIASIYAGTDDKKEEGGEEPMSRLEPYVISPAEFGEEESYETETLFYYSDGILSDSDNNMIEDIESCIGYESLNHFGEYGEGDDDSVYVRNPEAMIDYEVLLMESKFSDLEGV